MILDIIAIAGPWGWLLGALIASACWAPQVLNLRAAAASFAEAARAERCDREAVEKRAEESSQRVAEMRRHLQQAQAQIHSLTRYNGRAIEHEGKDGRRVRATVLGWYMDGQRPHLMIRTDAAHGRPSISYGVALAQCRFVDGDEESKKAGD